MSQKVTKLFSEKKTPPSKDATWGFWSKKSGNPWGGEFAVVSLLKPSFREILPF